MKWFFFHIFVLIFSSIMTFLYCFALVISPFIIIPDFSKEAMILVISIGIVIGSFIMFLSVKALKRICCQKT